MESKTLSKSTKSIIVGVVLAILAMLYIGSLVIGKEDPVSAPSAVVITPRDCDFIAVPGQGVTALCTDGSMWSAVEVPFSPSPPTTQ